ncbi:MAG TPA: hypothetical protein VJ499_09800 [Flavisolibacter sp.]|nr:hypothetical protein [Flavisolibacter sp.]
MKKLLTTIVLIVYAVMSTGFVVSLHYCMDKVNSAQLGDKSSDKCDRCGMHKDGHCCWDDIKVVKIQTSHLSSNNTVDIPPVSPVVISNHNHILLGHFQARQANEPIAHGPPVSKQDTYLAICVFRI